MQGHTVVALSDIGDGFDLAQSRPHTPHSIPRAALLKSAATMTEETLVNANDGMQEMEEQRRIAAEANALQRQIFESTVGIRASEAAVCCVCVCLCGMCIQHSLTSIS